MRNPNVVNVLIKIRSETHPNGEQWTTLEAVDKHDSDLGVTYKIHNKSIHQPVNDGEVNCYFKDQIFLWNGLTVTNQSSSPTALDALERAWSCHYEIRQWSTHLREHIEKTQIADPARPTIRLTGLDITEWVFVP